MQSQHQPQVQQYQQHQSALPQIRPLLTREAHPGQIPNIAESERFAVKWGPSGSFSRERASVILQALERFWAVMTGPECAFSQERGWVREKRGTHRMNVYITGAQRPCVRVFRA